eukprot:Transcript_851.p1 GENE.Transcript_851~~Transcript_851.p1  ORF type:complete len:320 (+),score=122.26 Transcript_851:86-961(+)
MLLTAALSLLPQRHVPTDRCRQRACPPAMRISIREAEDSELRFQGVESQIRPISKLVSAGFTPADASEQQVEVMASQLARNLNQKFSSRNPDPSALLIAESQDEVVAACGIEVQMLTASALDQFRYKDGDPDGVLSERPFLSNLAVRKDYRRKGIAKRLCRQAEQRARGWGYSEVLLKVEADNSKARNLYRSLGYRVAAIDKEAEKPQAGPSGVTFVPTTQVAMRKDLRFPPPDTVAVRAVLLGAAYYLYVQYEASGLGPEGVLRAAEQATGLDLQGLLPVAQLVSDLLPS